MDQELNKQTLLLIEKLDQLKEMLKEKYAHPDVISRIEKLEVKCQNFRSYAQPMQTEIWQENIMKRIRTIEDFIGQNYKKDIKEIHDIVNSQGESVNLLCKKINELSDTVVKLESHYYSDGDLSAIHGCIRNLEKNLDYDEHQLKRLEKKFRDLEQLFYDEKATFRNPEKKPHKCPVCDGLGSQLYLISQQAQKCESCEGKGIVWG